MNPGAAMLTRTLRNATSFASDLVKPTRPEKGEKDREINKKVN